MDEDINLSRRMLARLSELLRLTLDNIGIQRVPLRQELDFLKKYLEIEQTRFSDRLKVHYDVPSETHNAMVPALILQPLVENAVKHGIAPLARGGDIFIEIEMTADMLHISVRDNGNGISDSGIKKSRKGVGLDNVQKRLQQMYGVNGSFKAEGSAAGFSVKIIIPFEPKNSETENGPDHSYS
jgi:LytS/YehU family sensor histidine kinase